VCHTRENGNPGPTENIWIPASAGMTDLKNDNDFKLISILSVWQPLPLVSSPPFMGKDQFPRGVITDASFICGHPN